MGLKVKTYNATHGHKIKKRLVITDSPKEIVAEIPPVEEAQEEIVQEEKPKAKTKGKK